MTCPKRLALVAWALVACAWAAPGAAPACELVLTESYAPADRQVARERIERARGVLRLQLCGLLGQTLAQRHQLGQAFQTIALIE